MGSIKLFAELIAFHLHAEQRLNAVEAELTGERAVSNLREQFIAVLGHDLRNPLASVRAGVDLIRRRPQRALELVDCIDQSLARMTGLIDNILDFARGRLGGGINLTMHHVEAVEPMLLQVIQELQVGHPEREVRSSLLCTSRSYATTSAFRSYCRTCLQMPLPTAHLISRSICGRQRRMAFLNCP
jgi:signal transduction histidine kinase